MCTLHQVLNLNFPWWFKGCYFVNSENNEDAAAKRQKVEPKAKPKQSGDLHKMMEQAKTRADFLKDTVKAFAG